jgi:hypothetical protein
MACLEVLVHLVRALEELDKVVKPDRQRNRRANGRPQRVASANPDWCKIAS